METSPVRPRRSVLETLEIPVPTIDQRLSELEHPLIVKAQAAPLQEAAGQAKGIKSVSDRRFIKIKVFSWRGAAVSLEHESANVPNGISLAHAWWWLCDAGARQADSPQRDFYSQLAAGVARQGSSDFLLPNDWDVDRLRAEVAWWANHFLKRTVREGCAEALRTSEVMQLSVGDTDLRIRVSVLEDGQAYVAVGTTGMLDPNFFAIVLSAFDGISPDDWMPEPTPPLSIPIIPGEIVWSTMLPPVVQATMLATLDEEGR